MFFLYIIKLNVLKIIANNEIPFWNKTGDYDQEKKFIFNAKLLNQDLSVAEAGLHNNSNIFVVATKGIKGAY